MTPIQSNRSCCRAAFITVVAVLTSVSVFPADQPAPTPRPGTLGAYARKITLDRSAVGQLSGRLILTNETILDVCEDATITLGAVTMNGVHAPTRPNGGSAARRRWRAAHRRQQRVIADIEKRRSLLDIEIAHIKQQQLTPKILARLDRAEAKRRHLEQEIHNAREELAHIVREARRDGAEPEWFR